ncbi:MAG: hypothetical protein ACFHWX_07640 [Bacteroidota bacterium]
MRQQKTPTIQLLIMSIGILLNVLIINELQEGLIKYPNVENHLGLKETDAIFPFIEFNEICGGLDSIKKQYPFEEIQGFISEDNRMILTAIGSIYKVVGPKPIRYDGKYYLPWNKSISPRLRYVNTIDYPGGEYLFIPVKTMFHTHVIDGRLSRMDIQTAKRFPELNHLLIEKGQIVNFNHEGPRILSTYAANSCPAIPY